MLARDAAGRPIPVTADFDRDYDHSVVASPKPFPVVFMVRSEERRQTILRSFQEAEHIWDEMKLDLYNDQKK